MILHWLSASWRSLVANPLFSLITIISLSIGCCGALLAGANIRQHLSYEHGFADAEQILLIRSRSGPNPASNHPAARGARPVREGVFSYDTRPGLAPLIEGQLPGVAAMTRVINMGGDGGAIPTPLVDETGERTKDKVVIVDRAFFDVFEHRFVEGTKQTAFATPDSIVLTRTHARKLFGAEPALGKTLRGAGNTTLRVSAVVDDPPQPTMFDYEALVPIPQTGPMADRFTNFRSGMPGGLFVRLKPGVDRTAFIAQADHIVMQAYLKGLEVQAAEGTRIMAEAGMPPMSVSDFFVRVSSLPITDIHLSPREATGIPSTGESTMLWALAGAAFALLAVSGFNYVVLSLARAIRRRKEVAVRKVLGASKGAVTRHYLAEAALLTAISLALGFALAELLQPWFARILGQLEILFDLYQPFFLGGVAIAFLILALAVGAYPALYLAGIRPRAGLADADDTGGVLRKRISSGLLGLQIAAATILLAAALTMAAQARYVASQPLGFNTANLYAIEATCGFRASAKQAPVNQSCTATLNRLMSETPGIKRAAWSSNPAVFVASDPQPIVVVGQASAGGRGYGMSVDANFLPMAGAQLLAGRMFDPNSAYDRAMLDIYPNFPQPMFETVPAVVTRAMLPALGVATPEEALGKRFTIGGGFSFWSKSNEVIGVIEDWRQRPLQYEISPLVFNLGGTLMMPIAEINEADVAAVQKALSPPGGFIGDYGPFRIAMKPLAASFEEAYAADRNLTGAVTGFAMLAIFVACLGVYGLSSFDMRRRVREVGIRKALGASPARVAGAMFWRQLRFAALASLASWPIAWWISSAWLESYIYRTALGPAVLPAASIIILAFVSLAVGLNTARAAAIRPSFALRTAT